MNEVTFSIMSNFLVGKDAKTCGKLCINVVFTINNYDVNSGNTFYFLKTSLRPLRYFLVQLSCAPSGDQRGNEKPRVLEDPAVAMETPRERLEETRSHKETETLYNKHAVSIENKS